LTANPLAVTLDSLREIEMAKAKKGKGKTDRAKLPKTVAGIELPKELRKQGAKLLDLIKNPMVGDLVAAGLVALAANVRNKEKPAPATPPKDDGAAKPSTAEELGKTAATLATVVAARAAEKITSKLTERPTPAPAPTAPAKPAPRARAAAPLKAGATRKAPTAAKPKTPSKPKADTAPKPAPRARRAAPTKAGATRKPPAKPAS
jgi:hypothetical protein